ncbi:T9SS type A sorting domain-containing protein [Aureispira sp. CCB-E]|uniref:T9SS type A sorting domain-containing protein n=1 Tax=Aureispira sp. CCB-E TaxID=3051121 RepID=UPI002868A676|nr:T9SS type A sorting domain-containing protein [Aureispira sp. CCB-E]WMX15437.1 T9SS type A sorting domain-containing protein [Aureispira sp. CCB-E]
MMHLYTRKIIFTLLLSTFTCLFARAQNDCGSAVAVTDLTGSTCATSAPSTTNALGAGSCEEGNNDTWFQFTAQGISANITVSSTANGWRPEFLVVSGTPASTCAGFTEVSCNDQNGNYTSISAATTPLTIGETYWIVVSSNNDNSTGTLSVCVDNPAPPPGCIDNQDCSSPASIALNPTGGADVCVNDCNTGASFGPDFAGTNCFDFPNNTVWYSVTTDATATSLSVNLTSATLSNPEFTVFTTPDCSNFTVIDCVEGTGGSASSSNVTVTPNTTYLIAVSDATADQGTFDLCISQDVAPSSCTDNNECTSAATITLNASGGAAACVNDCNNGATAGPNFTGNNCYDLPNETVWYTFTTDAAAATLDINLTSTDLSNPEFTLFTNSCGPFTIINCTEGTGGSAAATQINIAPNTTYILAVSDVSGNTGVFDLCLSQDLDNSACNVDNRLEVTSTSMGSPLTGPFQAGEVVTFCYTINSYISSTTNCNYLHGIVPSFGNCWDPVSFDAQGQPTSLPTPLSTVGVIGPSTTGPPNPCEGDSPGSWAWFPDGAVTYNLTTPNPTGLNSGDNVGAGWFFLTSYASPSGDCNTPETDPNSSYGDNNFPQCADLGGWQVCFSLQVKDITACSLGETDCSVSMKTFSDGEIGVWADIGCTVDIPTTFPASFDCILLSTDLIEFKGKQIGSKNFLSWTIDNTQNLEFFRIEKSTDGINWETTDIVNSDPTQRKYSFVDPIPFIPTTYYRLKIIAIDGSITQSPIISVRSDKELGYNLTTELHPNPAKDYIQFEYTGNDFSSPLHIHIANMVGQTMVDYSIGQMDLNEPNHINTSALPDGIYYISITQSGLKSTQRITIIR